MRMQWTALGGLLIVAALAGCEAMNVNTANAPTAEAKQATFEAPLDNTTSADLTVTSLVSAVNIEPLDPSSPLLIDADLGYIGELTTTAEGEEQKVVTITDTLTSFSYNGPPLAFDIAFNRLPSLRVGVTSSSGDVRLALRDFNLNGLNVSTSSGAVEAELPAGSGLYLVNAVTASGDATFTLADNATVQFESVESSSGSVTINAGNGGAIVGTMVNTSSGNITLNFTQPVVAGFRVGTSSGNIIVNVPDGLPVRLEIVSNASGDVSVPAGMTQVQGEGDLGIWETADYPEDGPRIEIIVTSTASGDVTIQ